MQRNLSSKIERQVKEIQRSMQYDLPSIEEQLKKLTDSMWMQRFFSILTEHDEREAAKRAQEEKMKALLTAISEEWFVYKVFDQPYCCRTDIILRHKRSSLQVSIADEILHDAPNKRIIDMLQEQLDQLLPPRELKILVAHDVSYVRIYSNDTDRRCGVELAELGDEMSRKRMLSAADCFLRSNNKTPLLIQQPFFDTEYAIVEVRFLEGCEYTIYAQSIERIAEQRYTQQDIAYLEKNGMLATSLADLKLLRGLPGWEE